MKKKIVTRILVVCLAALVVLALYVAAHVIATPPTPYLTDGLTIREALADAPLRQVLWNPPARLDGSVGAGGDASDAHVGPDGRTLFFVRGRPGHDADLYVATRAAEGWTRPRPLAALNTRADELGPAVAPDGRTLYFHSNRGGGAGGYDLWRSRRDDAGAWSPPVNLGADVNSPGDEYGACVAPDGRELYFASNRRGAGDASTGATGYDLYVIALEPDGDPSRGGGPRPLASLNSPYDEGAPAVSPVGDFIYFASNRPGGKGRFDLYRARRMSDGFAAPVNLDAPVNTAANEIDPAITEQGFVLLFSSDRAAPDRAPAGAYALYASASREVFRAMENRGVPWDALLHLIAPLLPWLVAGIIAALLLPILLKLLRGDFPRLRTLSILARCLLLSLVAHFVIVLICMAWAVAVGIPNLTGRSTRGTRVALTSSVVHDGIALQVRGAIAETDAFEPTTVPAPRQAIAGTAPARPASAVVAPGLVAPALIALPQTPRLPQDSDDAAPPEAVAPLRRVDAPVVAAPVPSVRLADAERTDALEAAAPVARIVRAASVWDGVARGEVLRPENQPLSIDDAVIAPADDAESRARLVFRLTEVSAVLSSTAPAAAPETPLPRPVMHATREAIGASASFDDVSLGEPSFGDPSFGDVGPWPPPVSAEAEMRGARPQPPASARTELDAAWTPGRAIETRVSITPRTTAVGPRPRRIALGAADAPPRRVEADAGSLVRVAVGVTTSATRVLPPASAPPRRDTESTSLLPSADRIATGRIAVARTSMAPVGRVTDGAAIARVAPADTAPRGARTRIAGAVAVAAPPVPALERAAPAVDTPRSDSVFPVPLGEIRARPPTRTAGATSAGLLPPPAPIGHGRGTVKAPARPVTTARLAPDTAPDIAPSVTGARPRAPSPANPRLSPVAPRAEPPAPARAPVLALAAHFETSSVEATRPRREMATPTASELSRDTGDQRRRLAPDVESARRAGVALAPSRAVPRSAGRTRSRSMQEIRDAVAPATDSAPSRGAPSVPAALAVAVDRIGFGSPHRPAAIHETAGPRPAVIPAPRRRVIAPGAPAAMPVPTRGLAPPPTSGFAQVALPAGPTSAEAPSRRTMSDVTGRPHPVPDDRFPIRVHPLASPESRIAAIETFPPSPRRRAAAARVVAVPLPVVPLADRANVPVPPTPVPPILARATAIPPHPAGSPRTRAASGVDRPLPPPSRAAPDLTLPDDAVRDVAGVDPEMAPAGVPAPGRAAIERETALPPRLVRLPVAVPGGRVDPSGRAAFPGAVAAESAAAPGLPMLVDRSGLRRRRPVVTPRVPPPARKTPFAQRAAARREAILAKRGGSPRTEKAVADALDWLMRHQAPDGRWDGARYDEGCGRCGGAARREVSVAVTAIALLSYLAADHTHQADGPYRDTVARGLGWMLSQQSERGDFISGETMYSHGAATIALAEAYAMTGDPALLDPLRRATNFVIAARNRFTGGWRYVPGQDGDTSVLGWQVMSLISARRAGLDVPDEPLRSVDKWLRQVTDPTAPGRYAYRPRRAPTPSMTAEGMYVRQLLGVARDDPAMARSVGMLVDNLPEWSQSQSSYYWFYGSLALFQHGGSAWERWNDRMKKTLLEHQAESGPAAGSWSPDDVWAQVGGRVYQTALCALTLEVYYRYLPLYLDAPEADDLP